MIEECSPALLKDRLKHSSLHYVCSKKASCESVQVHVLCGIHILYATETDKEMLKTNAYKRNS